MADRGTGNPGRPGPGVGKFITLADVDPARRALLPGHGIVAGGDGFVSIAWRVTADLDAAALTAQRAAGPDQEFSDAPADNVSRQLDAGEMGQLEKAARAILSEAPTPQAIFTIDSLGYLFVIKEGRVFELVPTGPVTEGREAELHGLVYRLAWPE